MSLLSAISNSMSGMRAIQADMQIVSGNVSNAQNPNYTRKSILLSSDNISGGVLVTGYSRATNNSLSNLLQKTLGDSGLRGTQKDYLTQIQNLLGSSQDTPVLTESMSAFAAAWRQLSAMPESTVQKQDVIFKAQNLVREVNRLAAGLQQISTNLQNDMSAAVIDLNSALSNIANLNQQIISAKSNGQDATVNNLKDQRDAEVRKLSGLVNVRVFERSQDTISVYTPGGLSLLDGVANQFTWNGATININSGADVTDSLVGGRIEGLIGMLDQGTTPASLADPGKAAVYKVEQQLTELVELFTSTTGSNTFAAAYNGAATGAGELASAFFTGTTPGNFAVAAALTNGTSTVKQAAASVIATDMDVNTRTIAAPGLSLTNTSYAGFTDAIIGAQNQNTQVISAQADVYKAQADDYEQRLQSSVGVNIDDEMASLAQLQNNYAATARVISVIQQMFQIIQDLV